MRVLRHGLASGSSEEADHEVLRAPLRKTAPGRKKPQAEAGECTPLLHQSEACGGVTVVIAASAAPAVGTVVKMVDFGNTATVSHL